MASLRKRNDFWYIRYRDETGKQTEKKASRDKSVAKSMMKDLENRVTGIKLGTLDPRDSDAMEAERVPITQHAVEYIKNLEDRGCVPEHFNLASRRLQWLLEETKISRLSQLRVSLAESALKVLRDEGRSDQTVSHYATVWKSFSKWAWKDRRTRTDLLADLDPPKVVTTTKRSALTPDQASRLIEATRRGPRRRGMSGEDRAWLYTMAAITGLRRGELQVLTPESFNLEGNPPVVSLPGCDTKNSDEAIQPLPSHVVPDLRSWLAGKHAGRSLWPWVSNTALMVRADLKAAGIAAPDAYCFHSLRHFFVSAVVQCGGSVKDSMELARHHDADLTFNRYAHARLEDLSQVVNRLPSLWGDSSHALLTNGVSTGLNGTTTETMKPSPDETGVDPSGHDHRLPAPIIAPPMSTPSGCRGSSCLRAGGDRRR